MSEEQRKEFEMIALIANSYAPTDALTRAILFRAMKAAHNAAVRKCAESAQAFQAGDHDETPRVSQGSILKNQEKKSKEELLAMREAQKRLAWIENVKRIMNWDQETAEKEWARIFTQQTEKP